MPEIHFQTAQGTHGILTMGLPLESPPIRRGCRAMRVWQYFHRMNRLERLSNAMPQKTMAASMSFSDAFMETMEHLESDGIGLIQGEDQYGSFWYDYCGGLNRMLRRIENCDRNYLQNGND